jgi:hypothetical protein
MAKRMSALESSVAHAEGERRRTRPIRLIRLNGAVKLKPSLAALYIAIAGAVPIIPLALP